MYQPFCGDKNCSCQDGDQCHYVGDDPRRVPVSRHESNLRRLRCVVSGATYGITLHHAHGGSMLMLDAPFHNPGMGERSNPFFQIPIHEQYHVGEYGIDAGLGVDEWEMLFGTQLSFLHTVDAQLSYNIWQQAEMWLQKHRKETVPR